MKADSLKAVRLRRALRALEQAETYKERAETAATLKAREDAVSVYQAACMSLVMHYGQPIRAALVAALKEGREDTAHG